MQLYEDENRTSWSGKTNGIRYFINISREKRRGKDTLQKKYSLSMVEFPKKTNYKKKIKINATIAAKIMNANNEVALEICRQLFSTF
jgi:hypothetical protein